MEQEIRHKWEKKEDKWFMTCLLHNRSFEVDYDWNSHGICNFCGENAKEECKIRKEKREKMYRIEQQKKLNGTLANWGVE